MSTYVTFCVTSGTYFTVTMEKLIHDNHQLKSVVQHLKSDMDKMKSDSDMMQKMKSEVLHLTSKVTQLEERLGDRASEFIHFS